MFKTADLLDDNEDKNLQVVAPGFADYGKRLRFSGQIVTLKIHEDNSRVREAVAENGQGKVLVVDGGGSQRCALLGDLLAEKAMKNGWNGIIIYGLIRDSVEISQMELGVKALGTIPVKSIKRGEGNRDIMVEFHNTRFVPGHYLYADEDGVIVSAQPLLGETVC